MIMRPLRLSMLNARPAPPSWVFGCDGVEQGDTGAGALLPSSRARDLCACSVLTPWAWCRACGGGEPIPMNKTLSGGELIRCEACKTVRCSANCGCVFYNTPEVPDDRFMLVSQMIVNEWYICLLKMRTSRESPLSIPGARRV